jgi:hypothetical protein
MLERELDRYPHSKREQARNLLDSLAAYERVINTKGAPKKDWFDAWTKMRIVQTELRDLMNGSKSLDRLASRSTRFTR